MSCDNLVKSKSILEFEEFAIDKKCDRQFRYIDTSVKSQDFSVINKNATTYQIAKQKSPCIYRSWFHPHFYWRFE